MRTSKSIFVVCVVFLLAFCSGCSAEEEWAFDLSYELEQSECTSGDRVLIEVTVTNASGRDYTYEGASSNFSPEARLYRVKDGVEYVMLHEPIPSTDDIGTHIAKDGEQSTRSYYFNIPADAPLGEYDLQVSYRTYSVTYANVLTVIALEDAQSE